MSKMMSSRNILYASFGFSFFIYIKYYNRSRYNNIENDTVLGNWENIVILCHILLSNVVLKVWVNFQKKQIFLLFFLLELLERWERIQCLCICYFLDGVGMSTKVYCKYLVNSEKKKRKTTYVAVWNTGGDKRKYDENKFSDQCDRYEIGFGLW